MTIRRPNENEKRLPQFGYKFSNMKEGEFCKEEFVRISRSTRQYPIAFALGEESCGVSDIDVASTDAALTRAMAECESRTYNCRIIWPENQ